MSGSQDWTGPHSVLLHVCPLSPSSSTLWNIQSGPRFWKMVMLCWTSSSPLETPESSQCWGDIEQSLGSGSEGTWIRFWSSDLNDICSMWSLLIQPQDRRLSAGPFMFNNPAVSRTDLLPAGWRRAAPAALLLLLRVGSLHQRCSHHLQVPPPQHLQLQHPGQRGFEALPDADALRARPERVHAAATGGHPPPPPPPRFGSRAAGEGGEPGYVRRRDVRMLDWISARSEPCRVKKTGRAASPQPRRGFLACSVFPVPDGPITLSCWLDSACYVPNETMRRIHVRAGGVGRSLWVEGRGLCSDTHTDWTDKMFEWTRGNGKLPKCPTRRQTCLGSALAVPMFMKNVNVLSS